MSTIYNLSLSTKANTMFHPMSSVFKMIISANTEDEAREFSAIWNQQKKSSTDTCIFWCPLDSNNDLDIIKQKEYINCQPIGISMLLKTVIICTSEQHDTVKC